MSQELSPDKAMSPEVPPDQTSSPEALEEGCPTTHSAITGEQWKRFVESGDAGISFGLFTMCVMHRKSAKYSCGNKFNITVIAWLALCAQILLPIVFAAHHWAGYSKGLCPADGSFGERVALFGATALYAAKLAFRSIKHGKDFSGELSNSDIRKNLDPESYLSALFMMDTAWTILWEGMIYMINLWALFLAKDVEEIVLNCLAGEFMTQIDDEIVSIYIRYFGVDGKVLFDAGNKKASLRSICIAGCGTLVAVVANFCYIIIAGGTLTWGPICKPKRG